MFIIFKMVCVWCMHVCILVCVVCRHMRRPEEGVFCSLPYSLEIESLLILARLFDYWAHVIHLSLFPNNRVIGICILGFKMVAGDQNSGLSHLISPSVCEFVCFWDRVALCTPDSPGTHRDLSSSASRVLGLKCTITPGSMSMVFEWQ